MANCTTPDQKTTHLVVQLRPVELLELLRLGRARDIDRQRRRHVVERRSGHVRAAPHRDRRVPYKMATKHGRLSAVFTLQGK